MQRNRSIASKKCRKYRIEDAGDKVTDRKQITAARQKAAEGKRLSLGDALALYEDNDLLFLADCARRAKIHSRK